MFYHVIIEVDEKGNHIKYYDLDNNDLDDIEALIINPLLKKETVYINGHNIEVSEIKNVSIRQSSKSTSQLEKIENLKILRGEIFFTSKERYLFNDGYTTDITKKIMAKVKKLIENNQTEKINTPIKNTNTTNNTDVFIVHGQDKAAKEEVARFIEKLGINAIILHEQNNGGKTIIEKLEECTNVGYGIVLYTPCDRGSSKNDETLKPRARQNVVFEHGYLIGKLGRNKVAALVKTKVETPGDMDGVVYISLDDSGSWKISIARELREAGYSVDMNNAI